MLLFWSEDVGVNGQSLAAVRFPKPVIPSSIRIVPNRIAPFASIPSITGQTQPDAFALRVYFNVQQSQSADKQKPSNSLIPIDIEYNGDLVELPLNSEAITTRLIIFEGRFDKLSVAIYGIPAADARNSPDSAIPLYHPSILPHTNAPELPLYARVAEASKPSSLTEKLIAERHGHPFDLILRQLTSPSCVAGMEIGSCPNKLAECVISEVSDLEWLGMAVDVSSLPNLSHVPAEVDMFLARIEASFDSLKEFLDIDLGNYYFRILRNLSRQPDYVLLPFLQSSLLQTFLASPVPQPSSIQLLLDSVANPRVAQSMREECALYLDQIDVNPALSRQIYDLAMRIRRRCEGWALYEKFLASQQDFSDSSDSNINSLIAWVKDMTQDDGAIPAFLLNLLDPSYAPKANPRGPILLFSDIEVSRSVVPINIWLRAWVGVVSTAITLGWACITLDYDLVSILGRLCMLWYGSEYREVIELGSTYEPVNRHVRTCYDDSDTPQHVHDILRKIMSLPHLSLRTTISPSHDEVLDATLAAAHELKWLADGGNMIREDRPVITTLHRSITIIARWLVSPSFSATLLSRMPSSLAYILTQSGQLAIRMMFARSSPFHGPVSMSESIRLEALAALALISLQSLDTTIAKAPLVPIISRAVAQLVVETLCLSRSSLNPSSSIIKSAHLEWACLCLVRAALQASRSGGPTTQNLINDILEFSLNHTLSIPHIIEVTSAFLFRLLDEVDHERVPRNILNRDFTMAAPMIWEFLARTSPPTRASMIRSFRASSLPPDLSDWLIEQQVTSIQAASYALSQVIRGEARRDLLVAHVDMGLTCLYLLMEETSCFFEAVMDERFASALSNTLMNLYAAGAQLASAQRVCVQLCKTITTVDRNLPAAAALTILRGCVGNVPIASGVEIIHYSRAVLESSDGAEDGRVAASILIELGQLISLLILEGGLQQLPATFAEDIVALIQWCINNHPGASPSFEGSHEYFRTLVSWLADVLPAEKLPSLDTLTVNQLPLTASAIPMPPLNATAPLSVTINELRYALDPSCPSLPSTPPPDRDGKDQSSIDNPGIVANLVSPPILRSPIISMGSLPKRYSNNDFRQVRPASGTSRPPSTHVDEFTAAGLASPLLDF